MGFFALCCEDERVESIPKIEIPPAPASVASGQVSTPPRAIPAAESSGASKDRRKRFSERFPSSPELPQKLTAREQMDKADQQYFALKAEERVSENRLDGPLASTPHDSLQVRSEVFSPRNCDLEKDPKHRIKPYGVHSPLKKE